MCITKENMLFFVSGNKKNINKKHRFWIKEDRFTSSSVTGELNVDYQSKEEQSLSKQVHE